MLKDTQDNIQDSTFFFLATNMENICITVLPPVQSVSISSTIKLFQTNRLVADRDWGFNEKQTDSGGNETLVARANCCNNHFYLKGFVITYVSLAYWGGGRGSKENKCLSALFLN